MLLHCLVGVTRKALVKVSCLKGFIDDCSDSPSEIFNKLSRLRAPCATRLHSDGYKYMGGCQIIVLDPFVVRSLSSGGARRKLRSPGCGMRRMCPGRLRPTLKASRATKEPALLRRIFYRHLCAIQSVLCWLESVLSFFIARQLRSLRNLFFIF